MNDINNEMKAKFRLKDYGTVDIDIKEPYNRKVYDIWRDILRTNQDIIFKGGDLTYLSKFYSWINKELDRVGITLDQLTAHQYNISVHLLNPNKEALRFKHLIIVPYNIIKYFKKTKKFTKTENETFHVRVKNIQGNTYLHSGFYKSQQEALKYWVIAKHQQALDLADSVDDPKLKQALSTFYIKATFGLEY